MADMNFFTTPRWEMVASKSSRRKLFEIGDWLKFTEITPTKARLIVYDAGDLANEVLPSYIELTLVNGELHGQGYGRSLIKFKENTQNDGLTYEGTFENHQHQPDEGGDGDPK